MLISRTEKRRSRRVLHDVSGLRAPARLASRLLYAATLGRRTGLEEALHESGHELAAAAQPVAASAERAALQHDLLVGRLHFAEFLERRHQRAPQRDRHLQRGAQRPFLLVMVRADFLSRGQQLLVARLIAE